MSQRHRDSGASSAHTPVPIFPVAVQHILSPIAFPTFPVLCNMQHISPSVSSLFKSFMLSSLMQSSAPQPPYNLPPGDPPVPPPTHPPRPGPPLPAAQFSFFNRGTNKQNTLGVMRPPRGMGRVKGALRIDVRLTIIERKEKDLMEWIELSAAD